MHRKKPTSTKKKKEEQKLKRAIKRGDVEPPPPGRPQKNKRRPPNARSIVTQAAESSQKLQSSFIKTSSVYLKKTQELASSLPLQRPLPPGAAVYEEIGDTHDGEAMSCSSRPKWNYEMSKKEVEANEEGWFRKWLTNTDEKVLGWQNSLTEKQTDPETMPPSPTRFERNLEVWRQLWRVTEISQIILVLLDSRCPLVHLPPSLVQYLSKHQVILVLTKTDICGPDRASAWMEYLHSRYPQYQIVQVSSYTPKDQTTVTQGKTKFQPHLPTTFREQLVGAIRNIHEQMLEPPERLKSKPDALQSWKPKVKREIDWDAALEAGSRAGMAVGGAAAPRAEEEDEDSEPPYLTIGLIGQPNVGKSSLLNALFGESRVRASKTPGKTKHFQTLFWTSDIRLVDCPGLVMPNYIPMEMQVLSGVLPIARLSAISACVYFAAQRLPLEEIFGLTHPDALEPQSEDKRTWREGMRKPEPKFVKWTAVDVLVAYANKKGWLTAKAGRPDINRAGNAILRAVTENKVTWAFWPPGTPTSEIEASMDGYGKGLWIAREDDPSGEISEDEDEREEDADSFEEDEDEDSEDAETLIDDDREDEDSLEHSAVKVKPVASRFALLSVDDDNSEGEN